AMLDELYESGAVDAAPDGGARDGEELAGRRDGEVEEVSVGRRRSLHPGAVHVLKDDRVRGVRRHVEADREEILSRACDGPARRSRRTPAGPRPYTECRRRPEPVVAGRRRRWNDFPARPVTVLGERRVLSAAARPE